MSTVFSSLSNTLATRINPDEHEYAYAQRRFYTNKTGGEGVRFETSVFCETESKNKERKREKPTALKKSETILKSHSIYGDLHFEDICKLQL